MTSSRTAPVTSPRGRIHRVATVCCLIAIGAILVRAVVDRTQWVGWMPSTVAYWSDITVLASTVSAALAAWLIVPLRASGSREWVQIGARTRRELVRSAITTAWLTTGIAATAGLIAMAAWSVSMGAELGVAWPQTLLWWAGTVAATAAFALIGALLAWWIRGVSAIVVAPAVAYLGTLLSLYTMTPPPWDGLYAAVGESWVEMTATVVGSAARLGLWLGVATAIGAVLGDRRRLAWVALMVTSLSLTVGLLNGEARAPIPSAATVVCQKGRPTVCTREPWAAGLARSTQIIGEGYALLPDTLVPAEVGSDAGASSTGARPAVIFLVSGGTVVPTNLPQREATLADLGQQILLSRCTSSVEGAMTLYVWWRLTLGISLDKAVRPGDAVPALTLTPAQLASATRQAEVIQAWPAATRQAWFEEHATAIRECRLNPADLP